ncbi:AAA family ATPase [Anabaena sp. CCY 9910]|uniref:AAA family ATPase n=1 Tax=Anabaena sp. CCY 9910 TaxID=3103870 RepID=UPI0039E0C5B9
MPNNIPCNAYTDAPEQHPNLILGSLQLLFWLFFRPAAWRNHLQRIDPILATDTSLTSFISQGGRWRNSALWRLIIQGYLILPILANLLLGLVLWVLGDPITYIAVRVATGVAMGVVLDVILDVEFGVAIGVVFGVVFGVALDVVFGVALGMVFGIVFGVALGVTLDVAAGVAVFVAAYVAVGLGININSWRPIISFPFLRVWNFLLYRLEKIRNAQSPCLFRYHSAFWDEWQRLHLPGLDKHLLFVIEHNPVEGKAALEYLSTSPQRWAAQAVQIELDARNLQACTDVKTIRQFHRSLEIGELQSPVNPILSIFSCISEDVDAALNQNSTYNQRLLLRDVADKLNGHLQEFTRSSDKYTVRFRPIVSSWRDVITNYIEELVKATELRQEIDSPYITGVPLTLEQAIFTGRTDIGTRIEQLLLDRRRPPLLLYGQRRMGKTSLLNNIGKLLPNSIIPMFVDLQGAPSSANDYTGFLYNLARGMTTSAKTQSALTLPKITRETLADDPFTRFDEWLDQVEQVLEQNTALLMLDEFESLDAAISKKRFDEEDVLGMLRHLIQHRPRFKMLLAGSHTIKEYQRWASYLINVQVVHISYLKEEEARQLIEHPVKDFTLRYEPDAVERVLQLTRCHPFLVQLLCGEIIVLKNEQYPSIRRLASLADVEAAVPEALRSGGFFFADIQNNQVDTNGREVLRLIAAQGEGGIASKQTLSQQFPDVWERTIPLLLQRELIEEVADGYRFQVDLIRRWFVE